jgi:hypothetical protein
MITIGMQAKTENKDIGYFAIGGKGHKTGLEFGWSGLLKVVAEACHFELIAEALEIRHEELVQLMIDLYLERLVEDLLQLKAEDYSLMIGFDTTGGFRYSYLDPNGTRSMTSWTEPGPAVIASQEHASRPGY